MENLGGVDDFMNGTQVIGCCGLLVKSFDAKLGSEVKYTSMLVAVDRVRGPLGVC